MDDRPTSNRADRLRRIKEVALRRQNRREMHEETHHEGWEEGHTEEEHEEPDDHFLPGGLAHEREVRPVPVIDPEVHH